MNIAQLESVLTQNLSSPIRFILPDGTTIPDHFHVTEVGRVQKDFIDCGGTRRSTLSCLLQTWVADDVAHRLDGAKLAGILKIAAPILASKELPVEIEYERGSISQYPILSVEKSPSHLSFILGSKHTDCLAKEKCCLPDASSPHRDSCCGGSNCCE